MRRASVVWLVFLCVFLVLPVLSQQRSLEGGFGGVSDGRGGGEFVDVRMEESDMFEWTGLGARASQVVFPPDKSWSSGSRLSDGDGPDDPSVEPSEHDDPPAEDDPPPRSSPPPPSPSPPPPRSPPPPPHSPPPPSPPPPHHSPPPPSPPPPSPPPPPPSPPPPPPPLASLSSLEVSDGAVLTPPFHPHVYIYTTSVGEYVSKVRVKASVPSHIKVYELMLNSSKLISGEESHPIPIGGNGETVDLILTISAPSYSSNCYSLSVHRDKKSSIWWKLLKGILFVVLMILLILAIIYCCFHLTGRSRHSLQDMRWWPFGSRQSEYEPVNPDPSPLVNTGGRSV